MNAEEKFNAILSPVFGGELYPVQLPDMDTAPEAYGIYLKVGGQNFNNLETTIDLCRPRMQVSIYATSYSAAKTLEKSVSDAMKASNTLAGALIDLGIDPSAEGIDFDTISGQIDDWDHLVDQCGKNALPNVSAGVPVDGFEQETRRFYVHMDFHCWTVE